MLMTWSYPEFTKRCHERYGHTFTLKLAGMPGSVLTTDRDVVRRLFTGEPLGRRHANVALLPLVGAHSVQVLEPAEHLTRRRMLLPSFHGERVQSYASLIERLIGAELDRVTPGEVVAIHPIVQALTLDVILYAVLGVANVQMRERLREIFNSMISPSTSVALLAPGLSRRTRWNVLAAPFWRLKDRLETLLHEHIAATRADKRLAEREDVLATMVMVRDENGIGLTDEQLCGDLISLVTAGHETTATAITWGMELLVHNPAVMARAREGDEAYLDALAKEILRVRPPLLFVGGRRMTEPLAIGRWTIPVGTQVWVNAYGLHRDPAVYAEPDAFCPERFLEDPSDGYTFLPFGGGAHRCLGVSLAMLEMRIVLSKLLERFEFAPLSSTPTRAVRRGITIIPKGGARVRIVAGRAGEMTRGQASTTTRASIGQ
jgi:cytochrome P450 family 135